MNQASSSPPPIDNSPVVATDSVAPKVTEGRRGGSSLFAFRRPVSLLTAALLGILCIAFVLVVWWFPTRGEGEDRRIAHNALPSPAETFTAEKFDQLWFDYTLTRNLLVSLKRVVLGFTLAAAVAIPLGVLCGCFPWVNSFFAPINVFGRNIPIAALIPLTFALFGIGERQKVIFIFIAVVAFIMMDTASAIADVSSRYIDTAFTLGASRLQIILKVLVPLAMPRLFNSMRLLFGLAFGYIMLAESVTESTTAGGIGHIIYMANKRSNPEIVYLVLIVIPAVALAIDRLLFMVQKSLFPHQYGGSGVLHNAWREFMHMCEDLKQSIVTPTPLQPGQKAALALERAQHPSSPSSS
jgi:ABC-type nitrate/sulfonate/bicarbonate transport system permease component